MRNRGIAKKATMLSALGIVLMLGGCGKMQSPESLVQDAREYQQKGDGKAAVIQLKNALKKSEDNVDARLLLAEVYNDMGDPLSAQKEAEKALSLGGGGDAALHALGTALLAQGQYQKVIGTLAQANTRDAALLALEGNAHLGLGNFEAAKEAFAAALSQQENFPEAMVGNAKLALLKRDKDQAADIIGKALLATPNNLELLLFKGRLARMQGKNDEAFASYSAAIGVSPSNARARLARAEVEIAQGKYAEARADLEAAKKTSVNALPVLHTQALLNFVEGKHAAALEAVQHVVRAVPDYLPALLLAGAIELASGSSQQAEQHLKRYLDKDAGNLFATKLLAAALMKNGETAQALSLLTTKLKLTAEDPELLSLAGEAHMKGRDYVKASEYFEKASFASPDNPKVRTAFAVSSLALGDERRAISELEAALNLDGKSLRAGITLALTHIRLKQYDNALETVNGLVKSFPENPMIRQLKGRIYLEKNDRAAARAEFERALAVQPTFVPAAAVLAQLDLQDKRPEAARQRFEAILEKDKKNMQALSALATLSQQQGKQAEAKGFLERAVQENPNEIGPALDLAAFHAKRGEWDRAIVILKNLHALHAQDKKILEALASAQVGSKDYSAAIESYKRLAVLSSQDAMPHLRIASLHAANKNETAAVEALRKALALNPDLWEAKMLQVNLELAAKRFDKALKLAKQVQEQHSKLYVGHVLEGEVLLAQNRAAQAVKAFDRAYAMEPTGSNLLRVYNSLGRAGRPVEAEARLDAWTKANPGDTAVRLQVGAVNMQKRDYKKAAQHFEAVVKQDPANVVAQNNLAYVYHLEKDNRALAHAEAAHRLAPDNPGVLDTLGWILVERNKLEQGVPLLRKAASLAPDADGIRYHLAQALIRSGDKASARKELEKLLQQGRKFPQLEEAKVLLQTL